MLTDEFDETDILKYGYQTGIRVISAIS